MVSYPGEVNHDPRPMFKKEKKTDPGPTEPNRRKNRNWTLVRELLQSASFQNKSPLGDTTL